MGTFLQKHRGQQGVEVADHASGRDSTNDIAFEYSEGPPAPVTQLDIKKTLSPGRQSLVQLRQSLNQRAEARSLAQLQQRLNQSPRAIAQAKLASTLPGRNSAGSDAQQAQVAVWPDKKTTDAASLRNHALSPPLTRFAAQTTVNAPIQRTAQDIYDAAGQEKWREFIDQKDQAAALAEVQAGLLNHPGEYYDYQREGERTKVGDHWKAFQKADAYVSESIGRGTPLNADEYLKIHMLAAGGYQSDLKKGWRTGGTSWGLKDPTPEKEARLVGKGLTVTPEQGRSKIGVPEPARPMAQEVQALFDEYNQLKLTYPAAAAVELYEKLELLHPTKDASSRTNHLILNRLLAEYGLSPAILTEPNTPEQSYEQVTDTIIGASRAGHQLALSQGPESVAALRQQRQNTAMEEEMERRAAALLQGRSVGQGRGASSSAPRGGGGADRSKLLRLLGKK